MKTKYSVFIFLILILLLTGCGGKTEETQAPVLVTQPSATSEVSEAYPVQSELLPAYPEPESGTSSTSTSGNSSENAALIPSATPDPQKDVVIISNVTHSETGLETIMITNISDQPQDINGFSLFIPLTNEHINIFSVTLDPGQSYNVYNGNGAQEQTDGKAWLDTPLLKQSGDEIILLNRPGRVIWNYIYYP